MSTRQRETRKVPVYRQHFHFRFHSVSSSIHK